MLVSVRMFGSARGEVYVSALQHTLYRTASSADEFIEVHLYDSPYNARVKEKVAVNITIGSLVPITAYDVYCGIISPDRGTNMSTDAILATQAQAATKCCKTLSVTVPSLQKVPRGTSNPTAVAVQVDYVPSSAILVLPSYLPQDAPAAGSGLVLSSGIRLLPSEIRFTSASVPGRSKLVQATMLSVGTYAFVVNISGVAAEEYAILYQGGRNLTVLAEEDVGSAAPQLLHAVFNSEGYVLVSFSAATNRAAISNELTCTELLQFDGDSWASCEWSSDYLVTVYPYYYRNSTGPMLLPGSSLTLRSGVLAAKCIPSLRVLCSSYETAPSRTIYISRPLAPVVPTVFITAPSEIGSCASLLLDLTLSIGAAGRPWASSVFNVTTRPYSVAVASRLHLFLLRNYTMDPPTLIPSSVLTKGYRFRIHVTLCNFLGYCGSNYQDTFVSSSTNAITAVTIVGWNTRSVLRSSPLSIAATAVASSCANAELAEKAVYSWQAVRGDSQEVVAKSPSSDPMLFSLPAYSLARDNTYIVTLFATVRGTRTSASAKVVVLPGELVPVIPGGTARYIYPRDSVLLDASQSYDADYPGQALRTAVSAATGEEAATYSWSCITLLPVPSSTCRFRL
jgi:hypothetical protein